MQLKEYIKRTKGIRKVLLLGSGAVGKTTLVKILKEGRNLDEMDAKDLKYVRTHFLELESIKARNLMRRGASSDLLSDGIIQLSDVAGQLNLPFHALRDLTVSTLSEVDLVVLIFSNNSTQSLLDLEKWMNIVEEYYNKDTALKRPKYLLVKNKTDLESNTDQHLITFMANDPRISNYFEISCLNGGGVEDLKSWLLQEVLGVKITP